MVLLVRQGPLVRKAQSTRTTKFDPRTLSRNCLWKCPRECTRRCPRKCPRRLRLFLCKTHQRIPTKTPTRALAGNYLVLTGNLPVSTRKCTRKWARSIFTCPIVSGLQKGPAERGHVKKRQKSSKSVKKFFRHFFDNFSRRAKSVKNRQKASKSSSTLFDNFRAAPFFPAPFWGALILSHVLFLGHLRLSAVFSVECPEETSTRWPGSWGAPSPLSLVLLLRPLQSTKCHRLASRWVSIYSRPPPPPIKTVHMA